MVLLLSLKNHYDVGDVVEIDGFKGTVLEVSLKSTKIISWLNEVKIIANGNIKSVINFSKEPTVNTLIFVSDMKKMLIK